MCNSPLDRPTSPNNLKWYMWYMCTLMNIRIHSPRAYFSHDITLLRRAPQLNGSFEMSRHIALWRRHSTCPASLGVIGTISSEWLCCTWAFWGVDHLAIPITRHLRKSRKYYYISLLLFYPSALYTSAAKLTRNFWLVSLVGWYHERRDDICWSTMKPSPCALFK